MKTEISKNEELQLLSELNINEEIVKHPRINNLYVTKSGKVIGISRHFKEPKAFIRTVNQNKITGYCQISLIDNNKSQKIYVHRAILETFIDKPDSDQDWVVDHINSKRNDNRLDNLRWLSRTDNIKKRDEEGSLFKKTYIYDIKNNIVKEYDSRIEAAADINMFRSNLTKYIKLRKVVRGRYLITDNKISNDEYKKLIENN